MSWSWRLGRVAGIPIYVHWTFLILIGWIVFAHWRAGHDAATILAGVGFVIVLFGCVVLHELGHALAARRYGVPTADITLLPIGGVARLQRMPEKPGEELVVAIAGPAVNLAIVVALWLVGVRPPIVSVDDAGNPSIVRETFLSNLMTVNLTLMIFNLIPAFPMDGGRILRALLAMRLDYARATRIAASVGQMAAIAFGFIGLTSNAPMLLLIALFVWIGAEGEAAQAEERLVLKDVPVRMAMLTDYQTVSPGEPLRHAAELLLAGSQHDFPVMVGDRPVGVLTRSALMSGLAQGGPDAPIGDFMTPALDQVEAGEPLVPAISRLRETGAACLQVIERGLPVGLLTLENIGEYLMVRAALAQAGYAPGPGAKSLGPGARTDASHPDLI